MNASKNYIWTLLAASLLAVFFKNSKRCSSVSSWWKRAPRRRHSAAFRHCEVNGATTSSAQTTRLHSSTTIATTSIPRLHVSPLSGHCSSRLHICQVSKGLRVVKARFGAIVVDLDEQHSAFSHRRGHDLEAWEAHGSVTVRHVARVPVSTSIEPLQS